MYQRKYYMGRREGVLVLGILSVNSFVLCGGVVIEEVRLPRRPPFRLNILPKEKKKRKTYSSKDSLVVTDPTTNLPVCGLSTESGRDPEFSTACGRM